MVQKSKTYWEPSAKAHLAAAHILSRAAPNLGKSAPVVAKKVASFKAAAHLAHQAKIKPIKAKSITSPTPDAATPTPDAPDGPTPAVKPFPAAPDLKLPKLPSP